MNILEEIRTNINFVMADTLRRYVANVAVFVVVLKQKMLFLVYLAKVHENFYVSYTEQSFQLPIAGLMQPSEFNLVEVGIFSVKSGQN